MEWIYLVIAGLLEIGWPLGIKMAENPDRRLPALSSPLSPWPAVERSSGLLRGRFQWERHMRSGQALAQWAP